MPETLFIGIDIASKKNKAVLLDPSGERIGKTFRFSNDQVGAENFTHHILETLKGNSFDSVSVALEATGIYGWPLSSFLVNCAPLAEYSLKLYLVNPKLIKGFKKAYPDLPKTDDIDAFVIADRLRFGRLPRHFTVETKYLPIQRLTRFRFHLIHSISREKSYFLTNLFLKYSNFTKEKPFSSTFGKTSTSVITELSPDEIVSMSLADLVSFIMKEGKNRFPNPLKVAQTLKKVARDSYRLDKCMRQPVDLILASSLNNIRTLEAEVKKVDKAIERELKGIQHTLLSVDGIGKVFAAGIIAEIGDENKFPNHPALAKFAGLCWSIRESGDFKAEETRLIKSGNKYLRYYLVEAANSLRVHNPDFKRFYSSKYQESRKHHHKRALVLSARKLVRVVYCLLKTKKLYQLPKEIAVVA